MDCWHTNMSDESGVASTEAKLPARVRAASAAVGATPAQMTADVALDIVVRTARTSVWIARAALRAAEPVAAVALRPPLIPERYWPYTRLAAMAERGRKSRLELERQVEGLADQLVPAVLEAVLDRIDITGIVVNHVNIIGIVEGLDLNAIVESVDIDAIIATVDIDAIVARIDIDAIVAGVDIGAIVARLDIDAIVARVDIDAIVARIDIDAIVEGVDIEAIIGRLDLGGIATEVIEDIDLPEIIRESSGAMASESVLGVRMRGIEADERINRIVDRVMLRRRARNTNSKSPLSDEYHGD